MNSPAPPRARRSKPAPPRPPKASPPTSAASSPPPPTATGSSPKTPRDRQAAPAQHLHHPSLHDLADDPCPNAHVRQQTSAARLLDCRAYELVSAADAGGYDVESNLIPGQTPFGGYPEAAGRVLYGVHDGGIPGTGNPTNRGVDPYVATRGENGWTHRIRRHPRRRTPSDRTLLLAPAEADASLGTFAFGGPGVCSPCFADGSTGIPVRLPDGELVQGMAGPEDPGPAAEPDGYGRQAPLRRRQPPDLRLDLAIRPRRQPHGRRPIYDRDLKTGETHVVSKHPGGGDF